MSKSSAIAAQRISSSYRMEPSAETINIVFASDQNYIKYTAVTLASLLNSYQGNQPLHIFVMLDEQLDQAAVSKLDALQSIAPFNLEQVIVDARRFKNIRTSDGISIATYYRLLMHNLLPSNVEKALYLDSDLIILDSIDKLFQTPLDGNIFAGVEDTISLTYNKRFGIPEDGRHINAGVMLMDLSLMRNIQFEEIVFDYLEANRYRIMLGDQQIIAEIFHRHIKYVAPKWNVHGSMFKPSWLEQSVGHGNMMKRDEANDAIKSPSIIHYTLKRKPWMSLEHPKAPLWFDYLQLTQFQGEVPRPEVEKKAPAKKAPSHSQKQSKKLTLSRWLNNLLPAYLLSVARLRQTRLAVAALEKRIGAAAPTAVASQAAPTPNFSSRTAIELKTVLSARHDLLPDTFVARDAFERLPECAHIMSNVNKKDLEGGYAENVKTIAKTPNLGFFNDRVPDAVFLLSQRLEQGMFWDCIDKAVLYERPLYFLEVALFAAFASYFDPEANLEERRALGFIVDDMGFYFDAQNSSRLERTLNNPAFTLSDDQRQRAIALIQRICSQRYTKYNKYTSIAAPMFDIEPGSVLIIDQKKGDASIQFAGATDETFARMLLAAVDDNPDRQIYFKRHPDSIQRNQNSYRNRNISRIKVLPDEVSIDAVIDQVEAVYTVSSQVGFEALLRNKRVVTFGVPFYAGWGLTDDRCPVPRRTTKRTIEDVFYVACIRQSVYLNPQTGKLIEMEEMLDCVQSMRERLLTSSEQRLAAE